MSTRQETAFPDRFVFFDRTLAAGNNYAKLPTRYPVTFDIVITAAATVNIYASNCEADGTTDRWGAARATFTSSDKFIVEDEPFIFWRVEVLAPTGAVSVVAGG